jgi:hypothetical protein
MASFTDQISTFNPYIQQLPVEAMVQVGMQKQAQYDAGVQKIQNEVNQVAGISVLRPADKQRLQSKLNELGSRLKTVAAGDFSNQQLVNSVAGMTGQIINDKYIRAAVSSTAVAKQQMELVEQARQKGELTPDNEWFFVDKQLNKYLNDTRLSDDAGSPIVFNGKYIKHYDIDKDVNESIKAAHFDSAEWEELPKKSIPSLDKNGKTIMDKEGKPVMQTVVDTDIIVEKVKKGLLSGKVANIVGGIFAKPEVQQQLAISGAYTYKDYTPEMLKTVQDRSLDFYTRRASDLKAQYQIETTLSSKDANKSNSAVLSIDQDLIDQKEKYNDFIKLLNEGKIEEARIKLYTDNQLERYKSDLSWEENSRKTKVNPTFTTTMARAAQQLAVEKEIYNQFDANRKFRLQEITTNIAVEGERRLQMIAAGKLNPDGSPKIIYTKQLGIDPEQEAKIGSETFLNSMRGLMDEKKQVEAKIISGLPGYEDMYEMKDGKYVLTQAAMNMGTDAYLAKYKLAMNAMDKAYLNGTLNNNYKADVQKYYDLNSLITEGNEKRTEIDNKFRGIGDIGGLIPDIAAVGKKKQEGVVGKIGSFVSGKDNFLTKPQMTVNKDTKQSVAINKNDLIQFYIWENSDNPSLKLAATSHLKSKFGQDIGESGIYESIYGRKAGTGESRGGQLGDEYYKPYVKSILNKNKEGLGSYLDRENEYKKIQLQSLPYAGTFNIGKTEDKLNINTFYQKALEEVMANQTGGEWSKVAQMLDPTKPENLNANLYSYAKDRQGNYYLQISRNNGAGGFTYSPAIPTTPDVIAQMNVKEDPNEVAFNTTFGPFLDMNGGAQTTKNLMSPSASLTALQRKTVGKYSIGYHLKEFNGGMVPYLYIQDNEGNELRRGLQLDFSVFAKDPRLTPQQRAAAKSATTVLSKQDVLSKVDMFLNDEKDVELLLKN